MISLYFFFLSVFSIFCYFYESEKSDENVIVQSITEIAKYFIVKLKSEDLFMDICAFVIDVQSVSFRALIEAFSSTLETVCLLLCK
jgi:hypothetical protein